MQPKTIHSDNVHVQEIIDRFLANQDINGGYVDRVEAKLMKAVFLEVLDDAHWTPTRHVEQLIIDLNEKLKIWFN
jgi:hypothetical protein